MQNINTQELVFAIAGMHRSGTSLVASLLQSSGVNIGKKLMPPAQGNVKGYFENIDFVKFHEDVLYSQGLSKAGWILEKQIQVQEQYLNIAKLLVQQSSSGQLWGWKDPRTTLFLNFWLNLIPEAKFLLVYRAPWEVVDSLYRRGNVGDEIFDFNPNFAIKLWLNYNQNLINFYNNFPERCLLISIYNIIDDSHFLLKAIDEKFGILLNSPASDIYDTSLFNTEISNSQRPALINHYFPEAVEVYQELNAKALQLPGFSVPELPHFPSYQVWAFQDWLDVRKLERQESKLEAQFQQKQAELERSQSQLEQTQAEIERSQSQFQQTQAELERSQSQLDQSQSQLQQTQIELDDSQSQLQQTQAELNYSQSQLKHEQEELEQAQAIISGMESSKFWKLRTVWFRLKRALGLTDTTTTYAASLTSYQTMDLPDSTAIPEVKQIGEVKFKAAGKNSSSGFFDGINGSSTTTIELPQATPITASGWAILANEGKPADLVLITYGKNKSLVAVAPVNLPRSDVAKALKKSAYTNCGWQSILDLSTLPSGKAVLKAWAYNSATKEAIQLNSVNTKSEPSFLFSRLKHSYTVLRVRGARYALAKLSQKLYYKLNNSQLPVEVIPAAVSPDELYARWISKNFPREADLRKMAETVEIFGYKPVISIIMPVYNTHSQFLCEAIESVLNQIYPYWELCIADDASTMPHVRKILEEYASKDARIKVVYRTENGHISRASNSAIEVATGEFIALLDHDDLLTPDALYEVALLINRHPEADMIYSDEDKINEQNQIKDPFFKPDWCPDSFLSRMYTCHLGTYRRSLVDKIQGFRVGYEGSQDYDLVLRITEQTDKILHIPKILYHWRIHFESASSGSEAKPYAYIAAEKALSDALVRKGENGRILGVTGFPGLYSVRYEIESYELVSIIIPTRNLGQTLNKCLKSIFDKSVYPNYEVIVIDNGSTEKSTAKVINYWETTEPTRFRCCQLDIPFNFSKINNYGVAQAKGEYLLFLNNDVEVISPDWIDAMVEQAQRPSIGAVGALLLYPDKSIQHAGIVLGIGGVGSHSHKQLPSVFPGYFGQAITINNYSALTAACLMCRREVYESVEGFEEKLAVAYNDIDFCLKLVEKGYRNIYLPHVVLYHYESKTRGSEDTPEKLARLAKEAEYMQNKWSKILKNDPCYNPNLTRERDDYSINI